MYGKKVKTTSGGTTYIAVASEDELMDGTLGMCIACGAEVDGVEPDAREYECEACGEHKVYGLEELLLMGRVQLEEGE